MAFLAPCHDEPNAELVNLFVQHKMSSNCTPAKYVADRGREFCIKFADAACKAVAVIHAKSTAYHPTGSPKE